MKAKLMIYLIPGQGRPSDQRLPFEAESHHRFTLEVRDGLLTVDYISTDRGRVQLGFAAGMWVGYLVEDVPDDKS